MALHANGVSDHAPVELMVARRSMRPPDERPIAPHISRDRRFSLREPWTCGGGAEWATVARMGLYSLALLSAVRVVCDLRWGEQVGERSGPIVAVARAVAMQYSRGAQFLVESHPEVEEGSGSSSQAVECNCETPRVSMPTSASVAGRSCASPSAPKVAKQRLAASGLQAFVGRGCLEGLGESLCSCGRLRVPSGA